jgi:hypothetical protein
MGFADSVKKFAEETKSKLQAAQEEAGEKALAALKETLGDDINLITHSPSFDIEAGKFYDVHAPKAVLEKLRAAGLLRE